ncbi:hypothetical protein BH10BAC5_BH10BAC5_08400 [soil metagenome]
MDLYALILILIYLLTHIYIRYGLSISCKLPKSNTENHTVTVIVAAKNEEKNISRCISSLKKLDYRYIKEIFLVNDNSNDSTKEIMLKETDGFPVFKVIDSSKENSNNLKGKANALNTAIELSAGEIIIGTDADCEVDSTWVSEIVQYYDDETGMVCGFSIIQNNNRLFRIVQTIDWIYLQTLASGSCGMKQTLSCIGNNLSFLKEAYKKMGGYQSISFSVTEDFALMQKIYYDKRYNIKYPVNKDALIITSACENISEVYRQKRRWIKGGLKINGLGRFIGPQLYAANLIMLSGWIYLSLPVYLSFIILKFISEIILINRTMTEFDLTHLYKYFIPFQLYFALYGLSLPLTFLVNRRIIWKDRKF